MPPRSPDADPIQPRQHNSQRRNFKKSIVREAQVKTHRRTQSAGGRENEDAISSTTRSPVRPRVPSPRLPQLPEEQRLFSGFWIGRVRRRVAEEKGQTTKCGGTGVSLSVNRYPFLMSTGPVWSPGWIRRFVCSSGRRAAQRDRVCAERTTERKAGGEKERSSKRPKHRET